MYDFHIRPLDPTNDAEINKLYEICLKTGNSGADASDLYSDPMLIGTVYVGQYAKFSPHYAFVLADQHETVHGYVVGVADSIEFARILDEQWWPAAKAKYPLADYPLESATDSYRDPSMVAVIHQDNSEIPPIYQSHPAHFHIDLLDTAQGSGFGRKLLTRLLDEFRANGVHKVHLGVGSSNQGAIAFYEKMGFQVVETKEWGYLMGADLS